MCVTLLVFFKNRNTTVRHATYFVLVQVFFTDCLINFEFNQIVFMFFVGMLVFCFVRNKTLSNTRMFGLLH